MFGTLISNLLIEKDSKVEKIALGFIIGLGTFTFMLFLSNLCGIAYSLLNSSFILSALTILAFIFNLVFRKLEGLKDLINIKFDIKGFKKKSFVEQMLLITIALLVLASIISNLYWPIKEWDAVALYDFRARVFLRTGFMDEAVAVGYFSSYPLLTSIAHTWFYLVGSTNPKIIYSFFYLALILLFYLLCKKAGLKSVPALFITFMLSVSGVIFEHSQFAYTNLPYTTYIFLGIAYSYLWIKKGNPFDLAVSAILVALSTWARFTEPFWLPIVGLVFLYALIKRKYIVAIIYALSIFIFRYPWRLFIKSIEGYDPASEQAVGLMFKSIDTGSITEQAILVLRYLWSNVISSNLLLFIIFLCVMLYTPKIIRTRSYATVYLIAVTLTCLPILIFGTWMFSITQPNWTEIGNSANRMMMFMTPLILYCSALVINNNLPTNDQTKL